MQAFVSLCKPPYIRVSRENMHDIASLSTFGLCFPCSSVNYYGNRKKKKKKATRTKGLNLFFFPPIKDDLV